jgi:hypothetical protein
MKFTKIATLLTKPFLFHTILKLNLKHKIGVEKNIYHKKTSSVVDSGLKGFFYLKL